MQHFWYERKTITNTMPSITDELIERTLHVKFCSRISQSDFKKVELA